MELRDYQKRAVNEARSAFAAHRAVILCMPTGAGKTVVLSEIIRQALARRNRCIFNVHRAELLDQARDRLARFGIRAGIIKAGYSEHRERPVQVACVPTLVRRKFPPADLVIFDECHHIRAASFESVAAHYRGLGSFILGASATPQRLDGKGLGEVFSVIVEPVTTADLVSQGFLISPTVYAPTSPDLKGVRKQAGDYALPDLALKMGKLTGSITDYWSRYCRGRRTLAFAVNIEHSRAIEAALRAEGARVMHVDGKSAKRDRVRANKGLRDHTLDVVTQVGLWTEGVDLPELEALIVARPTASLSLHRQIIGRVMRTAEGKTGALVLDHAGNHHTHGLITDPIEWSLDARKKRDATSEPVRTCRECFAVLPVGAVVCAQCGAPLPVREEAEPPGVDNEGELVKFEKASMQDKQREYVGLVRTASARGYTVGWARFRYKDRFGVWPRFKLVERAEYTCPGHKFTLKEFGPKRVYRCEFCYVEQGVPA